MVGDRPFNAESTMMVISGPNTVWQNLTLMGHHRNLWKKIKSQYLVKRLDCSFHGQSHNKGSKLCSIFVSPVFSVPVPTDLLASKDQTRCVD